MSNKRMNVILTNMPTNVECRYGRTVCSWDKGQRRKFLNIIKQHVPTDGENENCYFLIHYNSKIMCVKPYDTIKIQKADKPKNHPDELIIEIIPFTPTTRCYDALFKNNCLTCIDRQKCTSSFITKYIIENVIKRGRRI